MILIIYLIGCVIFYIFLRRICKNINGRWTKKDRLYGLFISLFSWLSMLLLGVALLMSYMSTDYNSDDKANW
jgi:uncharacterized membrane protein